MMLNVAQFGWHIHSYVGRQDFVMEFSLLSLESPLSPRVRGARRPLPRARSLQKGPDSGYENKSRIVWSFIKLSVLLWSTELSTNDYTTQKNVTNFHLFNGVLTRARRLIL